MDFLESDAIAEEAVSVLKKELAAIKAGKLALNDRLAAVQAGRGLGLLSFSEHVSLRE